MGDPVKSKTVYIVKYYVTGKSWASWDGEDPCKRHELSMATDKDALRVYDQLKAGLARRGIDYHSLSLQKITVLAVD